MLEFNIKEARSKFSTILDHVEKGEEVIITRRGKRIARMVSVVETPHPLVSLKEFRKTLDIKGAPMSQTVIDQREKERY